MKNVQFSLIIPCHNEEENLRNTVLKSTKSLKKYFKNYEILIIDDNSADATAKIAKRLTQMDKNIRFIKNPVNLGQGISILIGFQLAAGKLLMHNGADLPFHMDYVGKLLHDLPSSDVVIAVRSNRSAYSFWRKITSYSNNFLRWLLFRVRFSDLNFVQIYKKSLINEVDIKSRSAAFITQELIIKASRAGYKISEVKIPYYPRKGGLAHHGKKRDILWALIDMLNFWAELKDDR